MNFILHILLLEIDRRQLRTTKQPQHTKPFTDSPILRSDSAWSVSNLERTRTRFRTRWPFHFEAAATPLCPRSRRVVPRVPTYGAARASASPSQRAPQSSLWIYLCVNRNSRRCLEIGEWFSLRFETIFCEQALICLIIEAPERSRSAFRLSFPKSRPITFRRTVELRVSRDDSSLKFNPSKLLNRTLASVS